MFKFTFDSLTIHIQPGNSAKTKTATEKGAGFYSISHLLKQEEINVFITPYNFYD